MAARYSLSRSRTNGYGLDASSHSAAPGKVRCDVGVNVDASGNVLLVERKFGFADGPAFEPNRCGRLPDSVTAARSFGRADLWSVTSSGVRHTETAASG
jgi:hypothetical protein